METPAPDPVDRLVAAYRDIAMTRMQGLPICNPALEVEAIGFGRRAQHRVGVLLTPWFMNLVLLPEGGDAWREAAIGSKIECRLPAGEYELTLSDVEGAGVHLSTPLFSTVQDFPDQETARRVALEVLERLYEADGRPAAAGPVERELAREGLQRPLSRRDLLRGRIAPGD
ncbi:MAG TPA: [NiFe]-hydrogenase assembly, chaperone, HybE [Gammaproteobacteria bacterium]|nr:[NiFe]-hydrogenase assembly, chaperone, HybE [Gammaproteobacteria bacterium]